MAENIRVDLGVRPTAVEEHEIDGRVVLVKRDDRIGGNKVRTLEFLLGLPAKRLLTYSTLEAHHAYATAVAGRDLGLETQAILLKKGVRGRALDALRDVARVVETGGPIRAALRTLWMWRPGTRIIPPGGMSPLGALGYLHAALELVEIPKKIYVPLGTGTTVSGLLAGLMIREADCEVVGVRIADTIAGWKWMLWRRAKKAAKLFGHDVEPGKVKLRVVKADGKYGEPTPVAKAAVNAAAECGLDLEPTYTGKTLAVLLAEKAEGAMLVNTYAGSGL
jgi:D-cysteine desulfhydrase